VKRALDDDPHPEAFEKWLLHCVLPCGSPESSGAVSAMARAIFEEWKLVHSMNAFKNWLERGAPSEDAGEKKRTYSDSARRERE
jgi:hypothetical protein